MIIEVVLLAVGPDPELLGNGLAVDRVKQRVQLVGDSFDSNRRRSLPPMMALADTNSN
jgi:hypothetical protein